MFYTQISITVLENGKQVSFGSDTISVSSYPPRSKVFHTESRQTIIKYSEYHNRFYINYLLVNVLVLTIPIFIHSEWGDFFCVGDFPVSPRSFRLASDQTVFILLACSCSSQSNSSLGWLSTSSSSHSRIFTMIQWYTNTNPVIPAGK